MKDGHAEGLGILTHQGTLHRSYHSELGAQPGVKERRLNQVSGPTFTHRSEALRSAADTQYSESHTAAAWGSLSTA